MITYLDNLSIIWGSKS